MSDDDDYYANQHGKAAAKTYLDYVEFCRAEFEDSLLSSEQTAKQQRSGSSEKLARNREKLAESRILDLDVLTKHQVKFHTDFSSFQEALLYLESIDHLNKYTSFLPLTKIFKALGGPGSYNFELLNTKKKSIVDTSVYKVLKKNRQINWSSMLNKLYPIKTIGDGNCLCHACLSYLVGFQDVNLVLREALKTYMNDLNCNKALKARWLRYRKQSDAANSIQSEEKQLNQEWEEIISLKSSEREADNDNEKAGKESTKTLSLIFLEDIHIFALANLLKRPIIVLSLETYKNIQPIQLRGIYLPLLSKPGDCYKEPIVIAFHNFHFMPLLFAMDEQSPGANVLDEKQFHFNNVDKIDAENLSGIEYELKNNYETAMMRSSDLGVSKMATRQARQKKLLNFLPLQYHNLELMELHFLDGVEDKKETELLGAYLTLKKVILQIDEAGPELLPYLNLDKEIEILCCSLTAERATSNGDGISTYIDFLNESILKNSQTVGLRTGTEFSPVSSSLVTTQLSTPRERPTPIKTMDRSSLYCANRHCPNLALDPTIAEYRGLCKNCFRDLMQSQENENEENFETPTPPVEPRRTTRSSASKENQYQVRKNLYAEEPVISNVTVLQNRDNFNRCHGNNCSQRALDGQLYCQACLIFQKRLANLDTRSSDKYYTSSPPYSSTQREIPITYLSGSNSNSTSSASRVTQIPITHHSSSPFTTNSKLYKPSVLSEYSRSPRNNYASAYNTFDDDQVPVYDTLGRLTTRCKGCLSPIIVQRGKQYCNSCAKIMNH